MNSTTSQKSTTSSQSSKSQPRSIKTALITGIDLILSLLGISLTIYIFINHPQIHLLVFVVILFLNLIGIAMAAFLMSTCGWKNPQTRKCLILYKCHRIVVMAISLILGLLILSISCYFYFQTINQAQEESTPTPTKDLTSLKEKKYFWIRCLALGGFFFFQGVVYLLETWCYASSIPKKSSEASAPNEEISEPPGSSEQMLSSKLPSFQNQNSLPISFSSFKPHNQSSKRKDSGENTTKTSIETSTATDQTDRSNSHYKPQVSISSIGKSSHKTAGDSKQTNSISEASEENEI